MATKKEKPVKATTASSGAATAKRNPFGNTGIRLFGTILAFIGILLLIYRTSFVGFFLTVFAVACMLLGTFVAISNLRKLFGKTKVTNDVILYVFLGIAVLAAGILLVVFGSNISKWFFVIVGALVVIYGLVWVIKTALKNGGKMRIFSIILAVLTIVAGIFLILFIVPEINKDICYYIFGGIITATGIMELLAY